MPISKIVLTERVAPNKTTEIDNNVPSENLVPRWRILCLPIVFPIKIPMKIDNVAAPKLGIYLPSSLLAIAIMIQTTKPGIVATIRCVTDNSLLIPILPLLVI